MEVTFPAMRGKMGKRDYFVTMVKLGLLPKLFTFRDWAELPPEQRAQRVLQKSRVPEITRYILENEDGYLFSSLTASFDCDPRFTPKDSEDIGLLTLPFEGNFVINDGQHRRAAILEALKENPTLAEETISVVFFPYEDLDRMQQMFSDLNRTVRKTSKSLDILYNHRDLPSQITNIAAERVEVFRGMVDKDRVSLPLRSPKLITLSALYDATCELLRPITEENLDDKTEIAVTFWQLLSAFIPEWGKTKSGDLRPADLRAEYIHTHAVVLWAFGAMGYTLISHDPDGWQDRLEEVRKIDWRRTNKEWQGIAMQGPDVVNRRQSRKDTASFLKLKMGLPLSQSEERSLKAATSLPEVISELKRLAS